MRLEQTLSRIDEFLGILQDLAQSGFLAGTESAEGITIASRLRTEFALIAGNAPTFTPDLLLELKIDLDTFLLKLEWRIASLLEPQAVQA